MAPPHSATGTLLSQATPMLEAARNPGQALAAQCPSCGHGEALDLLTISSAPVLVCSVFPDADAARATPGGTLHLVCCSACGFLFNRVFDLAMALAGAGYESTQAASPVFNKFADGLAHDWVERYSLRGKRVIEVGCGQGDFMVALLRAGVGTMHGIDPLVLPSDIPAEFADRVTLDASDFLDRHVRTPAAALVCRHSIEHIPDVSGFLRLVAAWSQANGNAPVLFEAPAAERIVHDGAFWDLFYEHCNYFTRSSMEIAFRRAGMEVTRNQLEYGDQYIVMDARYDAAAAAAAPGGATPEWREACVRFGAKASAAVQACRRRMKAFSEAPGGLVVWQGASKTVGLLTAIGSDVPLRFAVDQNVRRHGFYLPPWGLQVRPPQAIRDARPGHVVLMNAVYFDEVRKQLDAMDRQATVLHAIDDVIAPE